MCTGEETQFSTTKHFIGRHTACFKFVYLLTYLLTYLDIAIAYLLINYILALTAFRYLTITVLLLYVCVK